jgi:hypothetical protein
MGVSEEYLRCLCYSAVVVVYLNYLFIVHWGYTTVGPGWLEETWCVGKSGGIYPVKKCL